MKAKLQFIDAARKAAAILFDLPFGRNDTVSMFITQFGISAGVKMRNVKQSS